MAVDAQVVLSWLLTENVKTNNIFARNRLKDCYMVKEFSSRYSVNINYNCINTLENPADLITRG